MPPSKRGKGKAARTKASLRNGKKNTTRKQIASGTSPIQVNKGEQVNLKPKPAPILTQAQSLELMGILSVAVVSHRPHEQVLQC